LPTSHLINNKLHDLSVATVLAQPFMAITVVNMNNYDRDLTFHLSSGVSILTACELPVDTTDVFVTNRCLFGGSRECSSTICISPR